MKTHRFPGGIEGALHGRAVQLAGANPSPFDLAGARELVERDLLEGYLDFDPTFFQAGSSAASPEAKAAAVRAFASQYKNILTDDRMTRVLMRDYQVESLPHATIRALEDLVSHEIKHSENLSKHEGVDSSEALLTAAGISLGNTSARQLTRGAIRNHLYRLLLPERYSSSVARLKTKPLNTVCPDFAKAYLLRASTMTDHDASDASSHFARTIGSEGPDVQAFWTLAPYVFDEFRDLGLEPVDAMGIIFEWITDAEISDSGNPTLPYLHSSDWAQYRNNYVLGLDQRMPSHLLSRLFAKSIVEWMMFDFERKADASHS